MTERLPLKIAAYEWHVKTTACFICGFLRGESGMDHEGLESTSIEFGVRRWIQCSTGFL